jgi:hypothetical protein
MSIEGDVASLEQGSAQRAARQIVYLMAVLSTIFGVLYLVGLAGKLIVDGTVHSISSQPVQIVSAIIALLLDLALLILFVALRWQVSGRNAVFADLAVVFMILVCATSSISWFVQLAVLPRLTQGTDSTVLALIDIHHPGSVMYAIEHLGWGVFYGLATIFMAVAISGGRIESWIRWLFVAGGALSLLHVLGIITASPAIADLGYIAWGLLLPAATALLAIRFRRT